MKHQGIPFRKVLRATNKCTTLLEIKVKWYLTPIHWAGCRSLVVRTSYQWEGALALANQKPVFESRDMAWPIRGQINPCHLTSLTASAHLASPWQNFSRTWHNNNMIISDNKIFIIYQMCWVSHPDAVQDLAIMARVTQWSAVAHRVEEDLNTD